MIIEEEQYYKNIKTIKMIEERVVIQQHRDENDDRGKNSTNEI